MNLDLRKFDYLSLVRVVLKEPNLSWFTTVFFNLSSNDNLRIRIILLLNRLGWDLKPWITNLSWLISSLRLAILQLLLVLDLWYLTWLVSNKVWMVALLTKVLTHNLAWGLNEVFLNKAIFWSLPVTIFFLGLRDLTTPQPVQGSTFWYGVTWPWFLPLFLLLAFLKPTASGRLLSLNLGLESNVRRSSSNTSLRLDLINPRGSIGNDQAVGVAPLTYDLPGKLLQLDENDSLRQFNPTLLQFKGVGESTAPDRGILTEEIEKKKYLLYHNLEPSLNSDLSLLEWRESHVQFLSKICRGYGELNLTNLSIAEFEEVISRCNQIRNKLTSQLGNLEMGKSSVTVQWIGLRDLLHEAFPKSCSYLVNRVLSYYSKFDGDLTMEERVSKVCEFMDLTYAEMLRTSLLGRNLTRVRTLLSKDHGLEYLPYMSENLLFLVGGNKVQEMFNLQEANLADYLYLSDLESKSEWNPSMLSLKPLRVHVDLNGVWAELKSILYRLTGDSSLLLDGCSWERNELKLTIPIKLDLYECLPGKVMINEVETGTLRDNFWWNLNVVLKWFNQDSSFIRFNVKDTLNNVDVSLLDPLTYHNLRQQREKGLEANLNVLAGLVERLMNVIKDKSSQEEWELVPTLTNNEGKVYLSPVLNVDLIDSLKSCSKYLTDKNLNVNVFFPWEAEVALLEQVDANFSNHILTWSSWFKHLCGQDKDVSDKDYMLALKVFNSGNLLTMFSRLFKEYRKKLSYVLEHSQENGQLELRIKELKNERKKIIDDHELNSSSEGSGSLLDVELKRRVKMVQPTEQVKPNFIRDFESFNVRTHSLLDLSREKREASLLWEQRYSSLRPPKLPYEETTKRSLEDLDKKIKEVEDERKRLVRGDNISYDLSRKVRDRVLKDPEFNRKFGSLGEHLGLSLEEFTKLSELLIDSWSRKGSRERNLFVVKLKNWETRSRDFYSKEVYQVEKTEDRKDVYNLMWNLLSIFNKKDQHVISRKDGVVTFQLNLNSDKFNVSVQEEWLNQVSLLKDSQPKVLHGDPSLGALIPVEGRNTLLESLFDNRFLHVGSKKDNIVSIGEVKPEVISLFKFKQPVKNSSTPLWLPNSKRNLLDLEQENLINLVLTREIDEDDLNVLKILTSQHGSKWFTTSLLQILTGKFTDNPWSKFYIAEGYKGLSIPYFIVSSYNDKGQRNVKTAGWDKDSLGFTISRREMFRNLDSTSKLLFIFLNGWDLLRKNVLHYLPNEESRVKLLQDEEFLIEVIDSLNLKVKEKKNLDEDKFWLLTEVLTYLTDEKVLRFVATFVDKDEKKWVELGNSIQGLLLDIYDRHVSLSQLIDEVNEYKPNQPKDQTFVVARMFGADDVQLSKDLMTVTLPKDNELSFTLWTDLVREVVRAMSSLDVDVSRGHDGFKLESSTKQPSLLQRELKVRLTNHRDKLIESQERISTLLRSKDKLTVKVYLSGSKESFPNPSIRCDGKGFLNILFSKL